MSFISNLLPSYEFTYFDENQKIGTCRLNGLQCFLRKVLGCYKSTHLKNVLNTAYFVTFKPGFTAKDKSLPLFLNLFKKGSEKGYSYDLCTNAEVDDFTVVSITARYLFLSPVTKLSGLCFDFLFHTNNTHQVEEYRLYVCKDKERLYVQLPYLHEGSVNDSVFHIKDPLDPKNLITKTIHSFVVKLFYDSGSSFPKLYAYGSNYYHVHKKETKEAEYQNNAQDAAMQTLGWNVSKKAGSDGQRVYKIHHGARLHEPASFPEENISIAFSAANIGKEV